MLRSLKIRNLALVEKLEWELPSGFVTITGETGAGKSIILGALKFLVGERADRGLVRHGASSATLEALFSFKDTQELDLFLEERGVDPCQEGDLVLRRSISTELAGRQFINGSPCNLALLRDLGKKLIDLHGPHDHQSLFSRSEQTFLLDNFSNGLVERENYLLSRHKISCLMREKENLLKEAGGSKEQEYWKRDLEEIMEANIDATEEEQLLTRHRAAAQGKRLSELSALAVGRLSEDEVNVISVLAETTRLLRELARLDTRAEEELLEMDALSEKLHSLTRRLSHYSESIELDQQELQKMEERLDLLATLKRKYGPTLAEVVAHGEKVAFQLERVAHFSEQFSSLEEQLKEAEKEQLERMQALSKVRAQGAQQLIAAITTTLSDLGFRQAGFNIALELLAEPGAYGAEEADFLFAPNPGEPLQPLRMIASSGEVSRVMLAIKSAMAHQDRIPLLVFDEIDANVGGEIALRVGAKMKALGEEHQVLCITHLPQVAAAAPTQFVVEKEVKDGRTSTTLRLVEDRLREEEIARMLGGTSDSALAHARALLQKEG